MVSKNENSIKDKGHEIPQFTSHEEEANFWDTHDISEYWDELEPVKVTFAKNLSTEPLAKIDHDAIYSNADRASS